MLENFAKLMQSVAKYEQNYVKTYTKYCKILFFFAQVLVSRRLSLVAPES